ncbi:serine/threonine-protein kinase rio2-like [Leptopilina heterotoma]|uniref:serine/threonine-protein kinase rio2-like n=1 Tax=Leptopilina heterotoma TaxID=63436 RepID=UPI001CA8D3E4|nr:serine/threonine-protein kinase rio2-like [Leptopilina heterotoma]
MGERSKGKLSHASYGSSGPDRFHPGVNAQEAYWKSHHRGNPSIPSWQRDRIQADNQTYYIPDNCRKVKNHVNSKSLHPDYASHQISDPLFRHYQNYKSYRNKNGLNNNNNNAGISRKGKEIKENDSDDDEDDDDDDDGGDDDDGDDELGDDEYYENETNAKDEEENPVESCVSRETIEKDNEDPGEEVEENYVPPNYRNKFEKLPSSMMEKLKMLDIAHALKMNQQRRLQKKYQNVITTQRECQEIQNEEVTDEVTEGDDEIPQRQFRKNVKVPNNHRQPSSWFPRDHDNYNLIRSQQMYDYPRKYDIKQATLEQNLDYYSKKRPCRFCGGTGSDPTVSRKINCRVHDSTKVNYNSKEKFDGESGDQGERFNNGRRISPKLNLLSMSPTNYASQKARRSRNTRSPART